MTEIKGHIWKEPLKNDQPIYESRGDAHKWRDSTLGHNYCQFCGSKNLTLEKQICFGNPGYIVIGICRDCGHRF